LEWQKKTIEMSVGCAVTWMETKDRQKCRNLMDISQPGIFAGRKNEETPLDYGFGDQL
jgi:hypothetical protein